MAIRVKTESDITGSSEHVVTEDGLKAAGLDVDLYRPADDLKLVVDHVREYADTPEQAEAAERLAAHFGLDER